MRSVPLLLSLALLATSTTAAANDGSAEQFLVRAERLMGKGPFALADRDYKRLGREGEAAGLSIQREREAAEKAGKPILYCSPRAKAALGNMEFIRGLRAIPKAQRERLPLRAAMLQVLQKKYPCRR